MPESSSTLRKPLFPWWERLQRTPFGGIVRSAAPAGLRFGGAGLQLLGTIIIARLLGASEAGDFFFWATILMTSGQVATFGLDRLALQRVPRMSESPAEISRFLGTIRTCALSLALLLAAGLCAYSIWVQSEISRPLWWYLLPPICVAGVALSMINAETMTGSGRPLLGVLLRHTISTTLFVGSVVLLGSSLSSNLALAAYALAFFAAGFGTLAIPRFRVAGGAPFQLPTRSDFRTHLSAGLPICLSFLFAALSYMIPLTVLERTHPSDQMAFFTTAFRLFLLIEVLSTAIHSLAMPDLSRAAHAPVDRSRLKKVYLTTSGRGLALLGVPLLIGIILAQPVMEIFGEGFGEAAPLLRLLLAFGFLSLLMGPTQHLLLMLGKTRRLASYALFRMVFSAILGIAAIPHFGPMGMTVVMGAGILAEKLLSLIHANSTAGRTGQPKETA